MFGRHKLRSTSKTKFAFPSPGSTSLPVSVVGDGQREGASPRGKQPKYNDIPNDELELMMDEPCMAGAGQKGGFGANGLLTDGNGQSQNQITIASSPFLDADFEDPDYYQQERQQQQHQGSNGTDRHQAIAQQGQPQEGQPHSPQESVSENNQTDQLVMQLVKQRIGFDEMEFRRKVQEEMTLRTDTVKRQIEDLYDAVDEVVAQMTARLQTLQQDFALHMNQSIDHICARVQRCEVKDREVDSFVQMIQSAYNQTFNDETGEG